METDVRMAKPLINIIGGGIGGLTLARCLKRKGLSAVVYERAAQPKPNNYGILLRSSVYRQLLTVLDVSEENFKSKVAVDAANGGLQGPGTGSLAVHRGRFEAWLREGMAINWKHKLQKVEMGSISTTTNTQLIFEDESPVQTEITVGVDGPHSALRTSLFPQHELTILPYAVFNGKRRYDRTTFESLYSPANGAKTDYKQGDVRVNVTINDLSANQVNLSWTYSRPARTPADALHKPNRSLESATETPEEFFEEIAALRKNDMPQLFEDILDPTRLRGERILHWLMRTTLLPLQDLQETAKNSGVVFMGDAVHAEPILGGQGANLAIEDALSLAEWLANGKDLEDWYSTRYSTWKASVADAEEQIKNLHSPGPSHASL